MPSSAFFLSFIPASNEFELATPPRPRKPDIEPVPNALLVPEVRDEVAWAKDSDGKTGRLRPESVGLDFAPKRGGGVVAVRTWRGAPAVPGYKTKKSACEMNHYGICLNNIGSAVIVLPDRPVQVGTPTSDRLRRFLDSLNAAIARFATLEASETGAKRGIQ